MPRDAIRHLARQAERVLVAGAHLAAADPGLAGARAALDGFAAQLGSKAPAITQLSAAAARAIAATGAESARELVSLATMAAQVRSAQAQPAPAPAGLTALTATPALGTPCKAKELGEVFSALVEPGKGRQAIITEAVQSRAIADLRLVDALIHAMGDSWVGELVTTRAIPTIGPAIIAPMRAVLALGRGRLVDARRLSALVAVQKAAARDLIEEALGTGNAVVRETALDAINMYVRGDPVFEPLVLAAAVQDSSSEVRKAALRALAGYGSDSSLEALIHALDDSRTNEAAASGLAASRHPQAVDRMLTRLTEAVAAMAAQPLAVPEAPPGPGPRKLPPRTKKQAKAIAAATGHQVAPVMQVRTLLCALATQKDPRIARAAMPLLESAGAPAASAIVGSGDHQQLAAVADLLQGTEAALYPPALRAAEALGGDEAFRRLSAAFSAADRESEAGQQRLRFVCSSASAGDPRWAELLLQQLDAPETVAVHAIPLLSGRKERRAVKPLLKIVASAPEGPLLSAAISALGMLGDTHALDLLLDRLASKDANMGWIITRAVETWDDPALVGKIRSRYAACTDTNPTNTEYYYLGKLLRHLETRYPGH